MGRCVGGGLGEGVGGQDLVEKSCKMEWGN